jgi:NADPH:quinone reductase-like Zn-dependent oxidoreductase
LIFIRVFQSSSCRVFFKFPVDTTSPKKRLGLEAGRRQNRGEDVGQRSPKNEGFKPRSLGRNFLLGLGYEASGTVAEVGPGVTGLKPGDRVSSIQSFSLREYSTYGGVALLPAHALAKYPENLSPIEGASIWMQYLTAYGLH